jgi:hypothetical protein
MSAWVFCSAIPFLFAILTGQLGDHRKTDIVEWAAGFGAAVLLVCELQSITGQTS